MQVQEKPKSEVSKEIRDVRAAKQVKGPDVKMAIRFKRKPLL
jgi:hypothetical protein